MRLNVEVDPGQTADLRAYLKAGPVALTETWMLPWEAPPAPAAPKPAPAAAAAAGVPPTPVAPAQK